MLFELVSPEALLASEEAELIVVPGESGYFGVQKDHAPLMSSLQPGVIEVHKDGKLDRRLFVAGGFAQVDGERCTILADEAMPLEKLAEERETLNASLAELREDISDQNDAQKKQHLEERLALAEAKLEVIRLHC